MAVDSSDNPYDAVSNHTLGVNNMNKVFAALALAGALSVAIADGAQANVVLTGPDTLDGSYTPSALAAETTGADAVNIGGATGVSLWGALGGSTTGVSVTNGDGSNTTTYGDIVTNTPTGDNAKNAILRYYAAATNQAGLSSVISLGEISPFFGGTGAVPIYLQYGTTVGGVGSTVALVVPNQPGRDLSNVTSLALVGVQALPNGAGGQSTSVQLLGNTTTSGTYNLTQLQALPSSAVTAGATGSPTDTYTGVGLYNFLSPTSNNVNQIVIAQGTDGYEIALALGELDPGDGGNPNDLLAYSDTGTAFPGDGVARLVIPGDNHAGRWDSNIVSLTVETVPEPASFGLFAAALAGLAAVRRRFRPRQVDLSFLAGYNRAAALVV